MKTTLFTFLFSLAIITNVAACPEPIHIKKDKTNLIETCHDDWTSYINKSDRTVVFSFYIVEREKTLAPNAKRFNVFTYDPSIDMSYQVNNKYYRGSGYDRGHLFSNDDGNYEQQVSKRTFYFTNVIPQSPELNRGTWKMLEGEIRDLAIKHEKVYVYIDISYDDTVVNGMKIPSSMKKHFIYGDYKMCRDFDQTGNYKDCSVK
jgi:DNA/RNA endonuclease G (NUC1)